jgi:hypothetical protein
VHGVICAVAFCPQAPLLVPALTGGSSPDLDALRRACRTVVRCVGSGRPLAVLGTGDTSRTHHPRTRGSLAAFGMPVEGTLGGGPPSAGAQLLPDSLAVGAWVLLDALGARADTVGFEVGPDFEASAAAARLHSWCAAGGERALLVLGDGSAHRALAGDPALADRAAAFDGGLARALASAEPVRLAAAAAADDAFALCATGPRVWQAAAAVLGAAPVSDYEAQVSYDAAPFGVGYLVAHWTARTVGTVPSGSGPAGAVVDVP